MKAVERVVQELAGSDVPVLLVGEPGAGKKATAERIHQLSARREQPFHASACLDLPAAVFHPGENGNSGGTLFLSEVADLSPARQESLMQLLTELEKRQASSARLICGTARDLQAEVRAGAFREDLYYRISAVTLRIPPLRQRKEDIPELLNFFLSKYAAEFRCAIPTLTAETQNLFVQYAWPGNIRELEDAAKAIVALRDETLAMAGLRSMLLRQGAALRNHTSLKEAAKTASRKAEKELILEVLAKTRWNRRRAAQELQISYKALLYKLKQIGCGELGGAS